MGQQLKHALQPCIADVKVKWGKEDNFQGSAEFQVEIETKKTLFGFGKPKEKAKFSIKNQVPSQIPPIYDGNRLVLYKHLDKNYNVGDEITIKAKTVVGDLEHTFKVTSDSFIEGKSLHQLFARKMIQEIEEKNVIDSQNESKALIMELGPKFNLASKYTSFVGVDSKQNISHSIFMETRNVKNQVPFGHQMNVSAQSALFCGPMSMNMKSGGFRSKKAQMAQQQQFGGFSFGSKARSSCDGAPPGSRAPPPPTSGLFGAAAKNVSRAPLPSTGQTILFGAQAVDIEEEEDIDSISIFNRPGFGSMAAVIDGSKKKDDNNGSVVLKLTLAQNAEGSFPVTDDIAKIIGVSLTDMLVFGSNIDPRAWVTLVCIEFLEKFCQDEKDVWELVVLKAQTWLNKNFPNLGPVAKMVAKDFVSKNVRQSQKTCPLGHQLFLVPSTKVGSGGWYCDRKILCSGGHGNAGLYANVQVWRCEYDWRMKTGGTCDFDLCDDCARVDN